MTGSPERALTATPLLALALLLPGATDLSQESAIIWVITGISAGGAAITFAFLAYAIIRFRDPKTKGRRYG